MRAYLVFQWPVYEDPSGAALVGLLTLDKPAC